MTSGAAPTIAAILEEATWQLREAGVPDPRRDASSLLAWVLGIDRGGVFARRPDRIESAAAARFAELIAARAMRKPLQHLEGRAEFRGLDFEVSGDVLIPRPETEALVQCVLDAGLRLDGRIADLGTGSGCIAISLATERPAWRLVAVDLSPAALRVAERNAAIHGVAERIEFVEADFAAPRSDWRDAFDAVVSNPPYVPHDEWEGLQPEVRDHEPRLALVPGPTGNEAYDAVARAASSMLRIGGLLTLELGWKSENAVRKTVAATGFQEIGTTLDFQGIARVLTARKP